MEAGKLKSFLFYTNKLIARADWLDNHFITTEINMYCGLDSDMLCMLYIQPHRQLAV